MTPKMVKFAMRKITVPLETANTVEVDCVNEKSWHEILQTFRDASVFQTWAYGAVKCGEDKISHTVIRKNNQIVAAAQVLIVKVPVINAGFAYVRWGPLWKRHDVEDNIEDFRQIVMAMRREYVDKRGLYLRVVPAEIENSQVNLRNVLEEAGYGWRKNDYQTLYVSLNKPLEAIRDNMSKNWRKNLKKAESNGIEIVKGKDHGLFENIDQLYREMLLRKGFGVGININEYRLIQEKLPYQDKMFIIICRFKDKPIAGLVGSAIGNVGIEIIAASGSNGLELRGSYLLRWEMVEYLKQSGCHFYNLHGINPQKNPGGYQFKAGLCGKEGLRINYIGIFEAWNNPFNYLAVRLGEAVHEGRQNISGLFNKFRAVINHRRYV